MKTSTHPAYSPVVFRDITNNTMFLTRSTAITGNETITWDDGKTYPIINVDISSTSHPAYTGEARTRSPQGMIQKYLTKYGYDQ